MTMDCNQQQVLTPPAHNQSHPQQQQQQQHAISVQNNDNRQVLHLQQHSSPQHQYVRQQQQQQVTMTTHQQQQQKTSQRHPHTQYDSSKCHTPDTHSFNGQNLHQQRLSYNNNSNNSNNSNQHHNHSQQARVLYRARPMNQLDSCHASPLTVNAPPTPPSEDQHHTHSHSAIAPQQTQQQRRSAIYHSGPAQVSDSRCHTGEWVMQTIQQQQQQPQMLKQHADYGQQPSTIASYYYDIDDGFSDIMSAPASPEPSQQQQPTGYPSDQYGDHHHYLPYASDHQEQCQLAPNNINVQVIEHHHHHHQQQQQQQQQQFLSHQHIQQRHHHQQSYQHQHQQVTSHEQQQPHLLMVPYAAAMSPDSSSLSTTSSSPCDHSLYQASPPMPSCARADNYCQYSSAAHHNRQQQLPLTPPAVDALQHQQPQTFGQPMPTTTRTTTKVLVQGAPASHQVVLEPIGDKQLEAPKPQHQQPQQQLLAQKQPQQVHHRSSPIHLWEFLKELLQQVESSCVDATIIRWLDRQKGVFKIEDSVRVAKLWGKRKNKPKMNYDKLSRSIRQYYKKGIMKKTDRSQRLVYQFCSAYCH